MTENQNKPRQLSLAEAARIGSQSRRADVEAAKALRAQFTTPESQPILTPGDEFEQRIMRGPTDTDIKQMLSDEDAERWQERAMSPEELAEQAKWDKFASDTAASATKKAIPGAREHRIDVRGRSKAEKVTVTVIPPMSGGMEPTEHMLDVNTHYHNEHSGEVDKAS